MLAGRPAFARDTTSDTLAAILELEPDWSALPSTTPAGVERLLRRSLEKDPRKRIRDIGDVLAEIDHASTAQSSTRAPSPQRARRWGAAAAAAVVVAVAGAV